MNGTHGAARWLSGRAVALHLALLLVLPMCGIAAWWQVDRALSGNILSWLYVFEWPAFAGIGVWLWWVLLTTRAAQREMTAPDGPPSAAESRPAIRSTPLQWEADEESEPLRAYNSYLRELNAGRKASRPRGPGSGLRRRARAVRTEARAS